MNASKAFDDLMKKIETVQPYIMKENKVNSDVQNNDRKINVLQNDLEDLEKDVIRKEEFISEIDRELEEMKETAKMLQVNAYSDGIDIVN
mgnify:CR=1 FL=1